MHTKQHTPCSVHTFHKHQVNEMAQVLNQARAGATEAPAPSGSEAGPPGLDPWDVAYAQQLQYQCHGLGLKYSDIAEYCHLDNIIKVGQLGEGGEG